MERSIPLSEQLRALLPQEEDVEGFLAEAGARYPRTASYLNARLALTEAFLHRQSLEDLTALAERLLDRPLAVFDLGNSPLVMGPRFSATLRDPVVAEFRDRNYISSGFARLNQFRDFAQALARSTAPFTFRYKEEPGDPPIIPRRVHKVYIGGVYMAHCTMLLERDLTDQDDRVLAHFCSLVCQHLERVAYRPYQGDFENALFRGLLDGRYRSERELKDRLELQSWRLYHNFYLLNVPRRKREVFPDPASMQFPALLFQGIQLRLSRQAVVHRYVESHRLLLLLDLKDPADEGWMKELLDAFFREQELLGILSRRFDQLPGLKDQAEDTEFLLSLAAGSGLNAGLLDEHALYFHRLAYFLRDVPADLLCPPRILALQDTEEGRSLLETVLAYLDLDRSVQRSADLLGLHRNTVMRRLARFRELTGLNVENGADTCRVYLAARLMARSAPSMPSRGV